MLLLFQTAAAVSGAVAQPARHPARSAAPLPADRTSRVTLRQPPAGRLRAYREQRAFQYVEARSERSGSSLLWARLWNWLDTFLSTKSGRAAWEYGFYTFLIGALGFVVLKLLQVDLTRAFGRAPRRSPLPYDAAAENIHALDFNALLAEAEAAGNYRLAVRLGYLAVLKQLTDRGLIQWQPEKTNHDYLRELTARPLRPAFRELTQQFEYVWYGEQNDLPAAHYALARDARVALQQLIATSRPAV
ncbi:DUF4129 domain-containing protein [Hymenobacter aquaticus]|uniref:DUF4129 domain-containing protein n=1 Tax=Hymenobacter aquaticus TaxID=1867101 RepID=UPI001FD9602F|nr:DUF4129 domain-containing protein [Hymenobacter aquaticus]